MLNIISRSYISKSVSGPKKVVDNLIKGLDLIGYPYCVNKALDATSELWIHDDTTALREASRLGLKAIVGPNLYILPRNIPADIDFSHFAYIHPSPWAADFWKELGFTKCPLDSWPAGIDTNEFSARPKPADGKVLVYFKDRLPEELEAVEKILSEKSIAYDVIRYGSYKQADYMTLLSQARYVIWIGRQESQGIALEEALSMNVPIVVWDVTHIGHWQPTERESKIFTTEEAAHTGATSAYYFDNRCGIITKNPDEIPAAIERMEKEWQSFEPRAYIVENLNLEKQARAMLTFFEKYFGITYEQGLGEKPRNSGSWINAKWYYVAYMSLKDFAKKALKPLRK